MKFRKVYLLILLIPIVVWFFNRESYLKVAFLDVGQGDAIYIETPDGRQMLIDGGADYQILNQLSKIMPFGDRSIDVVLATHPDTDHIGGLVDVLNNYSVGVFIENGAEANNRAYANLKEIIVNRVIAKRGMRIILEDDIYFDILFPDRDISDLDSNDSSIVGKLVYEDISFMLTGDATVYTEIILHNYGNLKSNVLKVGHHGAKTSSSLLFLQDVDPEYGIISAGLNNRYKHPHQDVLDKLKKLKINILSTFEQGNIIFKTNGQELFYNPGFF
ncbi:MAG: ComEC/Rec2 family competence protein [Patescibacteria group bacterium]|nr:ComEC/Rec2 family competence protein [Patescibacteria group bacterium]